ncbi:MAG: hypothetical protein WC889_15330, partial [Myxococcota bacterium]
MAQWLCIPLGVVILGLAAWEDLWTFKIRNSLIVTGLIAAAVFHGASAALGFSTMQALAMTGLSGATAIFAGYAMWHYSVWSAGDAKLFAVATVLLPPRIFEAGGGWLPPFSLMVNASLFVLMAGMWWFVRGLWVRYTSRRADGALPAGAGNGPVSRKLLAEYLPAFLGFMVFMVVARALMMLGGKVISTVAPVQGGMYVAMFILMRQLSSVFRRRSAIIPGVLIVVVWGVWAVAQRGAAGLYEMLNMSGISAALMVFRLLYDRLVRELDERAI